MDTLSFLCAAITILCASVHSRLKSSGHDHDQLQSMTFIGVGFGKIRF